MGVRLKRELPRHRLAATCLHVCPQNHQLAYTTSCGDQVTANDLPNNILHDIAREPTNEIHCLDFNTEGNRLATAGGNSIVRIYDTGTNMHLHSYSEYKYESPEYTEEAAHIHGVYTLKYHPHNNNIFVTGGWDNHLKICNSRRKNDAIKTIHGTHEYGDRLDLKGDTELTG